MQYLRHLLAESWRDTWQLVIERSIASIVIAMAVFLTTLVIYHFTKRHEEFWFEVRSLIVALIATVCVFVLVFFVHFLFLTPKRLYESTKSQPKPEESPRIRLDVADEESRKRIADLEKQLAEAKGQRYDPLSQPIVTAIA